MARWAWPTAAGVVTSATGVVINLATDREGSPWAWAAVVLLTACGIVIALRAQPTPQTPSSGVPSSEVPSSGVHNELTISGTATGPVIQVGRVGAIHDHSVNQTATAHENSTIHQAGRDITP